MIRVANLISNLKIVLKKKQMVLVQEYSKQIIKILDALWNKKLIAGFCFLKSNLLKVYLKYSYWGRPLIKNINLVSTPGRVLTMKSKKIQLKSNPYQKNNFFFLNSSYGTVVYDEGFIRKLGGKILFKLTI